MAPSHPRETHQGSELQRRLRWLLADRHSPEASALFQELMKFSHRRVVQIGRRCGRKLGSADFEEIVSDVLLQLMRGGLTRFRGHTMGELFAFVRTISDRSTWRAVRRLERERALRCSLRVTDAETWTRIPPGPDRYLQIVPDSPLGDRDQTYLRDLLEAGSKAELARRVGVSRAAVTQRVQRIRARIDELAAMERMAHEAWMLHAARRALQSEEPVVGGAHGPIDPPEPLR